MPRTTLEINGKDNATPSLNTFTKGIIGGGLAIEALNKVTQILIDLGKEAIKQWNDQEKALIDLKSIVGNNTSSYEAFASEMQKTTNIADDQILRVMKLGLQYGISKNNIQETTREAIGLSKAFGIDLEGAIKLVSMAQDGNYTRLTRFIPAMATASSDAEKHSILMRAVAQGYAQASNNLETFAGIQEQDKLISDDLLKVYGHLIETVSKDGVKAFSDMKLSALKWLESGPALDVMAGAYAGVIVLIKDLKIGFEAAITPLVLMGRGFVALGTAIYDVATGKFKELPKVFEGFLKDSSGYLLNIKDDFIGMFTGVGKDMAAFKKNWSTMNAAIVVDSKATAETISADFTKGLSFASNYTSGVSSLFNQMYQNQIDGAEKGSEKEKELKREQFVVNKAFAIAKGAIDGISATIAAFKDGGWPLAIATGILVAAQEVALAAQPMPAFAGGGVVQGNSYSGDNVMARVNSGEMILTVDQQKALLSGKGGGGTIIHHYGNIIASDPLEYNRKIQIQARRLEAARGVKA